VKIGDIRACTQELIGGDEVRISLIKLGPFKCIMPTRMEHGGECSYERLIEAFSDTICVPYPILDVEMELLQVCGPFLWWSFCNFPCVYMNCKVL
jgi:hypothetical protein